MKNRYYISILLISLMHMVSAQNPFIIIDQFGYLPSAEKIAVIKNPQTGYDSEQEYDPGTTYAVVEVSTGEEVYSQVIAAWKSGSTDASSGDQVWHFDFSAVTEPGTYYILDKERGQRSFEFRIAGDVYNEVLKHAVRSFFYQRSGFEKSAEFAGEGWADGASHLGDLQDLNCRSFFDKNNPASEKDVSGGWYDAGDFNKYTNWTADYVVDFMKAYLEKPDAWADDYNIPESGNGIPDLLDEARWGVDHLLRLQQSDGSVLSIVGAAHGSPPSSATGPSYYGPVNTSATLNTSAALALASKVYRIIGLEVYADTLEERALKAWDWAVQNPEVLFDNNDPAYNSSGLGAGRQEVDSYGRGMSKLEAACYLFDITGETAFRDYFDANYTSSHLKLWNYAYPFETTTQDALLYYLTIENGTSAVKESIRNVYKNAILTGSDNLPAITSGKDPYGAYLKDYTWGSNAVKSAQGGMYFNMITYELDPAKDDLMHSVAQKYIHYIHGVNPLNLVYLSNMFSYGADQGVREFYHTWFKDGSALWDRTGVSTYGPPPGFLTGGANPSYNWDGCCPSSCGSYQNNSICTSQSISPPANQPVQKSYKDFNTSWPLNSWSVTENSCGYQIRYIRLLSKYVTAQMDCNGDVDGTAFMDSCGRCAGGNTGVIPELDPSACAPVADCNGDLGGTAFLDSCNICSGGNTNRVPVLDEADCIDCNGDFMGTAFIDICLQCAGGNTGIEPVTRYEDCLDCHGDFNGTAFLDSCQICSGGETGREGVIEEALCYDCYGEFNGTAFIDSCSICAGGNTGVEPVLDPDDCVSPSVNISEGAGHPVIYPNPAGGELHVMNPRQESFHLLLIDINGRTVLQEMLTGNQVLDIHRLSPGYYEVIIRTGEQLFRNKLIKIAE